MIGSKYRPFQEQTSDVVVDLEEKIEEIERVGCEGKSMVIQSKGLISVVSTEGKQLVKIQVKKQISNIVMMPAFLVVFYQVEINTFTVIRNDFVVQYIQRDEQSSWANSRYQLEYFKNIGLLGLIQKNVQESRVKISYYQYQNDEETLKETHEFVVQPQQWFSSQKIFKVNEDGMLGWCWAGKQGINLSLYSGIVGFKKFEKVQNSWSNEIQVLGMASGESNLLHLAIKEGNSFEQNRLPVIVIEMKDNFSKIQKVRPARALEKEITQSGEIAEAMTIGNYFVFKLVEAETSKILIYSLEFQSFVHEYVSNESSKSNISHLLLAQNEFIESFYGLQNKLQIRYLSHKIFRVNSLSVLKLLQVLGKIDQIVARKQKKNVILICGAHKSGKSTLRHFICGEEMQHLYLQDVGYYELRAKSQAERIYEHEIENDCLVGIGETEEAVVVEMFDWSQVPYFKSQTLVLLEAIFKKFKSLHCIVTIPYEQVQDSIRNEQVFKELIELLSYNSSDEISSVVSIVLTKIEDESALQEFGERIEQITELNEEIGGVIKTINDQSRIYLFENKQYSKQQSQELKLKILQSKMMEVKQGVYLKVQGELTKDEESQQGVECLLRECEFYLHLMNNILQYLSSWIVKIPSYFVAKRFEREVFHIQNKVLLGKLHEEGVETNSLQYPFFWAISNLKLFVEKKQLQTRQGVQLLKILFKNFVIQYEKIANGQEGMLISSAFAYFFSALNLPSGYIFQNNQQGPYKQAAELLRDSPNSVLGNGFRAVYEKLMQNERVKEQKELINKLKAYVGSGVSGGVVKTKIVAMSYEQQRSFYLKQKDKLLQTICGLPANVMKLDLMMHELGRFSQKTSLGSSDFRLVKFYLRECSRLCHFHSLHRQAIIFLMVIPDFNGIDILVQEMMELCKSKEYDQKKLLDKEESDLIQELMVITRDCVRDNLTEKLIHLMSLNMETMKKHGQIRSQERESKNNGLSSALKLDQYQEKLSQRSSELKLWNLKNQKFRKLIDERSSLVDRCREFERGKETMGIFADRQALNWALQTLPIPF